MGFPMLVQIVTLDKPLIADFTTIPLLTRVYAHMPLKILIALEGFRTDIAHKRRLFGMAQLVAIKVAHNQKALWTFVALKRLVAAAAVRRRSVIVVLVRFDMGLKIGLVLEALGTDITLMRPRLSVHQFMGQERLLRLEGLCAQRALERLDLGMDKPMLFQILHLPPTDVALVIDGPARIVHGVAVLLQAVFEEEPLGTQVTLVRSLARVFDLVPAQSFGGSVGAGTRGAAVEGGDAIRSATDRGVPASPKAEKN